MIDFIDCIDLRFDGVVSTALVVVVVVMMCSVVPFHWWRCCVVGAMPVSPPHPRAFTVDPARVVAIAMSGSC